MEQLIDKCLEQLFKEPKSFVYGVGLVGMFLILKNNYYPKKHIDDNFASKSELTALECSITQKLNEIKVDNKDNFHEIKNHITNLTTWIMNNANK